MSRAGLVSSLSWLSPDPRLCPSVTSALTLKPKVPHIACYKSHIALRFPFTSTVDWNPQSFIFTSGNRKNLYIIRWVNQASLSVSLPFIMWWVVCGGGRHTSTAWSDHRQLHGSLTHQPRNIKAYHLQPGDAWPNLWNVENVIKLSCMISLSNVKAPWVKLKLVG